MSHMRFPVAYLVAFLGALSLAACGSKEEPSSPRAASQPEPEEQARGENPYLEAKDLCALVPLADVAAAAGGTAPLRSEAGTSVPASCRYFFDVPDPSGPRSASATLEMLSDFRLERMGAGKAAQDVEGLGDDAWARAHTDSYLLYVQRGSLVFRINVAGVRDPDRPSVARKIAEVVLQALNS